MPTENPEASFYLLVNLSDRQINYSHINIGQSTSIDNHLGAWVTTQ